MGKPNKAITKGCPYCGMQIAVACKNCPGCKRVLISNNKRGPTVPPPKPPPPPPPPISRRTSRIKREKPKFYDASQFENKKQKRKRPEPVPEFSRTRVTAPQPTYHPPPALNRKKLKKKVKTAKEDTSEEEDKIINAPAERLKQFSVVLSELNMKLFSTSWTAT